MDPQRWQEIERLYHAAAELEGGARAAFLAQACGGDDDLRQEVESLLAGGAAGAAFMEAPVLELAARELAGSEMPVKSSYAHYRILEKLGEGGMGTVYAA